MEDDVKTLLNEEITGVFGDLTELKAGTEDHQRAVADLVKLYQLRIDEAKLDCDVKFKRSQSKDEAIGRYVKLGVEIAGIVLPLMFYGVWMTKGLKFEETGTFQSTTFRGLFSKFRPTKV